MKKVEVSKKITIEFTEKELLAILFCLEDYLVMPDKVIVNSVEEKKKFQNLVRNLVGLLKQYLFK